MSGDELKVRPMSSDEKIVMATHSSHCGGTCLLKVHVKDGVITRIETDDGEEPQYRACARGRAMRQRVYGEDRILYPLKRVGERGEGKFERISWDEALDKVASELNRVRDTYGPASILFKWSSGDTARLHVGSSHRRLLFMNGGCSEVFGIHSFEAAVFAQIATFGTGSTNNTRDNLLKSKLIIMWGWNPAESIQQTPTAWLMARAREAGIRIINVDPRYTRSAVLCADQWIPIRPGTDSAMQVAMAYVILKENLQDQKFIDKYTIGIDQYRDYLFGVEDGITKTPQWAEPITGVPAADIEALAREYATTKPAALMAGISPGRTAYGEQHHRAATILAAITGNIGIVGGDAGISADNGPRGMYPFMKQGPRMALPENPVAAQTPRRKFEFPDYGGYEPMREGYVTQITVADAILKGKAGGYPADYKMMYVVNNNFPNQYPNINKCVEALKKLEFNVVYEQFMTPAAKYADIVLPTATSLERMDITAGGAFGFHGFMGKAVDPVGETRSHFDILCDLATRLGISDFTDKTEEEWCKSMALGSEHITDWEAFKKAGVYKIKRDKPYIAFSEQIEDLENNPFNTPSGKIEIYCQRLADMDDPLVPPVPKYIETWESPNDPLASKYPLQLITTHFWRRAHSQYDNLPWLNEIDPQAVQLNSIDAKARGLKTGDMVRVFNDRGVTVLTLKTTERLMPGVVDIPQGAWYDPDENGVDRAGSSNVLTKDMPSPGGAFVTNTTLVQVGKA